MKLMLKIACGGIVIAIVLLTVGCAGSVAQPEKDGADKAEMVTQAEAVVKKELPDIPLWKGTTFKGMYQNSGEVCVDRTYKDGKNAGFVIVSFPDKKTSEPKDGTCASPAPEPIDWQARIEDEIKDKLGGSNRDSVERVASVVYVDGVNVPVIKWAINENITEGLTKKGAKRDVTEMLEVLQELQKDGMPLKGAKFEGTYSLVDQLGNESEDRVVLARFSGSIIKQINFDNFIFTKVYDIADSVSIHPAFED
jgi:hypothetical protein